MKKRIIAVTICGVFAAHSRLHAQSTTYTPSPVSPVAATATATSTPPKPVALKMVPIQSDSLHTLKTAAGANSPAAVSGTTPVRRLTPIKAQMAAPDTAAAKKAGGGN